MKTSFFFCILQLLTFSLLAQFTDDFSGGSLGTHWQGDIGKFAVTDEALQLNDEAAASNNTSSLYAIVPTSTAATTSWELYLRCEFAPSSSNFTTIYLAVDQPPVPDAMLEGYYLKVGGITGSDDALELYRQDGTSSTLLIGGTVGAVGSDPVTLKVLVERTAAGEWTLEADYTGGEDYDFQGTATDATYTNGQYFGMSCKYTSTRSMSFFFDDIQVDPIVVDEMAPQALSVSAESNTNVVVQFDELLAESNIEDPSSFNINNGIGAATTVSFVDGDRTKIQLDLATPLVNLTTYVLTLNDIEDLAGNVNPTQTLTFDFLVPEAPEPGDLIFTEIFPDPTPSVGLPDFEYIELLNTSDRVLQLGGLGLSNGGTAQAIDPLVVLPGAYIIVCDEDAAASFVSFGEVATIPAFPALTNGGDDLILTDAMGLELVSLTYSDSWYQDDLRGAGGYSLELIDPTLSNSCPGNWRASLANTGGTPGQENSLAGAALETNPPLLLTAFVPNSTQILLYFDDILDSSIELDNLFSISPTLTIGDALLEPDEQSVRLFLSEPLIENTIYNISALAGLMDCLGNATTVTQSITVGLTESPEPGDLIFTEIFPDPTPIVGLPDFEYIELLNTSDKILQLGGLGLSNGGTAQTIDPLFVLPGAYIIVCDEDAAFSFASFGEVATIPAFPALTNSGDDLILTDATGVELASLTYSASWFQDDLRGAGGYSLELIDPDLPNNCPGNWRASLDNAGGTPGKQNSLAGATLETNPPVLLTAFAPSNTQIILYFDDVLNNGVELDDLFSISPALTIGDVLLEPDEQSVRLFLSEPLIENTIYNISALAGLMDCLGNTTTVTQTIAVGLAVSPEPGDLIINELLFNPYTGGVDFLELYNPGPKILNMAGLRLRNELATSGTIGTVLEANYVLLPDDYVVITPDPDNIVENYTVPRPAALVDSSLPSMADDEGNITIYNAAFDLLDALDYTEDWHSRLLSDRDGVSLERLRAEATTQNEGNWASAASTVGYATPTGLNSQDRQTVIEPKEDFFVLPEQTFSPDEDGFQDVLEIQYSTDKAGYLSRILIFDTQGRLVRRLDDLELLAGQGSFLWDGSTDEEAKARIGIYIVVAEIFTPEGDTLTEKHTCVLAGRLD